jgi:hypothetical protein
MTDDQKSAFGFSGKSITWTETIKLIEAMQQQQWMLAIPKGKIASMLVVLLME